jgi:phage/plasmid-associated DNA primase
MCEVFTLSGAKATQISGTEAGAIYVLDEQQEEFQLSATFGMVTAIEANYNRHLDEAKIKAMTGGEPIVARFMRQNFFSFVPAYKLWFVANETPKPIASTGAT